MKLIQPQKSSPAVRRRRVGGAAGVLGGAILLAGMSAFGTAGASTARSRVAHAGSSTLVWGLNATPRTLFGPTDYSSDAQLVMTLIQGQMLTYGPKEQLQPAILSSSTTVSPLEYQYTVRPGVKFSDGNPVTAADVAYTLNLQLNPKVGSQESSLFANVKSVTSSGDTVTMKLIRPDALVHELPASICGLVYEEKSVAANLADYGTPQVLPVGAGPYEVSSYVPDSQIVLVRNPYYYGAKPKYDQIIFKIIPDTQTMLLALRSGEINGTFDVESNQAAEYKKVASVQSYAGLIWNGLTLDMTERPFNNIHVREALYYATNRQAIAQGIGAGYASASSTVDEPGIFDGTLSTAQIQSLYSKIEVLPYSVAKAKAQLAESPVPHGFTTTLNVPEDSPDDVDMAQILKSDWAKIGVTLKLRLMPGGPRFQIILDHKKNLGVQIIGNIPDALDPTEMVWEYFSSTQAIVNGNNSSNLRVPAIDSLISQSQASEGAKSSAFAIDAEIAASKQVSVVPLIWRDGIVALQKGLKMVNLQAFTPATYWVNDISGS
ncbi:MAG: transporter substrate-binding protein [Acidimicrobiaceae bacterium]|nr:transporter substrate-binding protein [Acidimicrobiaceae bacterium]